MFLYPLLFFRFVASIRRLLIGTLVLTYCVFQSHTLFYLVNISFSIDITMEQLSYVLCLMDAMIIIAHC